MATGFYLLDNPQPITAQYGYPRRGASLSGTCIIHTAECLADLVGADTSAENTANFIRTRADYGSYHTLVDSDSIIEMAPYEYETWQDSQTNPWAVGISAAVQADFWHTYPLAFREKVYRNMAAAAADFVRYMKTKGITVPVKRITGAQARARVPGFCAHGDSGVDRHDPGSGFDWTKFLKYVNEALGTNKEDTLTAAEVKQINAHTTAEVNRGVDKVIDYLGAVLVSGYTVGDVKYPGIAKVDIQNQKEARALDAKVTLALSKASGLTTEQIEAAVKKAITEGAKVTGNLTIEQV